MINTWIYLLLGATILTTVPAYDYNKKMEGPAIIPKTEEIILQNGQNYTMLCKGRRPLQFKKEELSEESTFSEFSFSQKTLTADDVSHDYTIALELSYIDEYAVGYYACFDDTIDPDNVLIDVLEEPINTPHISYIYIYVNGTEKVIVPMSDILKVEGDSDEIVIKCRPTLPDVNMTLIVESMDFPATVINPNHISKVGYVVSSEDIESSLNVLTCIPNGYPRSDAKLVTVFKPHLSSNPKPTIEVDNANFIDGDNFTMRCKLNSKSVDLPIDIVWTWPNKYRKPIFHTNLHNPNGSNVYYKDITIINAREEDEGNYSCSVNGDGKKRIKSMIYREPGYLKLKLSSKNSEIRKSDNFKNGVHFTQDIFFANPRPEINYYYDGNKITYDNKKYKFSWNTFVLALIINNISMDDSGNYTCVASNPYNSQSVSKFYDFQEGPFITFDTNTKEIVDGQRLSLSCSVKSNPIELPTWFIDGIPVEATKRSFNRYTCDAILEINVHKNTMITCSASKTVSSQNKTKKILVYELNSNGFGIKEKINDTYWISENENAVLTCIASNNKFSNCTWFDPSGNQLDSIVTFSNETLSYKAKLQMKNINLNQAGEYQCVGFDKEGAKSMSENIVVHVAASKAIAITFPETDMDVAIASYNKIVLKCEGEGIPPPQVEWKKDGEILSAKGITNITTVRMDYSKVKSTIVINEVSNSTSGKYQCIFKNNIKTISRAYMVEFVNGRPLSNTSLAVLASVLIGLTLLVFYLIWKMWKDKKKLRQMGMGYFKQGRKLNPNLGLDEQADMLPYDERFEFPRKKLTLGELLGSGAFGAVYKAEARGIINAERTDIVAVKMVKKDADLTHIVALASELKIMIHLGKHVNIVNLLGACTKNLVKSELLVIVEYCEFGNLHNYVRRHREVFIDQLTDNSTKYGKVNRGYSCSNNTNSGTQVDYCSEANVTQNTDHTFLNTGNSNRSTRLASERSNMTEKRSESNEYSDGRQLRPLCSRDLLAWSFQIARGMEYLASRKVFHGDLAARNILLANDNVVKICDFGLARSIYKNEEYLKHENSLLPVKWLAIECMTERAFSTQSDVWAFGIVLWELFSLAMSPYPHVSHSDLLEWLQQGNRLEKPAHADDRIYEVMLRCWHHKPQARPTFSKLEETLGSFLDDNDRNHYVDLNAEYINYNLNHGGPDYLAMIAAPEYNIATPNPNEYVNVENERRFFPRTPLPEDEQGYLQVTPKCGANPRDHNKFEFNSRRSETESHELTPMLSTNNLPSGSISESDQEGNISPYPKMCPRIEEEDNDVDDVFENNHNNIKNTVTNPTYITITADIEKKPVYEKKEFLNNYVNVSNGLVK